ncbi:MAG: hypothetical protein AABX23_03270 [Nanoarchaeota archaeon]
MVIVRERKGDVTISTVILIVLGLAVLVMLIVGFTKGWDFFFGAFDNAPSELQTLAKACALYAQGTLRIDFCSYKLIGDEIVNCRHPTIIDSLKNDGVNTEINSLRCDMDNFSFRQSACQTLAPAKPETKITTSDGEKTCADYLSGTTVRCTGPVVISPACSTYNTDFACRTAGCTWT